MNTGSESSTTTNGKSKVSATDVLQYIEAMIKSDDGTITVTKRTSGGKEYLDIAISGSAGAIASVGDTYKVKGVNSSSTEGYLDDVLKVDTGIKKTSAGSTVTLELDAELDDLSDVDGCASATTGEMLVHDGTNFTPAVTLIKTTGDDDLGADVLAQDSEIASRGMVARYFANLIFGAISGDGEDYNLSSMWRSKEVDHIAMSAADDTGTTAGADGYPPAPGLLSLEIGDNTGGTNYTRYVGGTKIETTVNADPSTDDPAYLSFGALVEEDWNDTDATPKIYLDLILCNATTASGHDQDCDIKVYCRSFKSLADLSAPNDDDDTVTKQWATAGHPGDFWIQYATCEFSATTLDIANGYRALSFNIVSKVGADPVIVIGARLRYKKMSPDIRIADSLIITEP